MWQKTTTDKNKNHIKPHEIKKNKINRILVKEKQCRHRADEWYNGTAKTQGHGMTAGTDSGRSGRRMFSECRGKWSVGR